MASLAQIHANQANALRSTGPKTAEGKAIARRNALKHGLAAATLVLPDAEGEVIAARILAWTPCLQPQDAYEDWLVSEVVVNSVRINRCHAHETSARTRQAARASLCWEIDRECEAEDLGERLSKAPAKVARTLQRTKQGCAWLIARWEGLSRVLQAKGDWDAPQQRLALDLLGTPKELREGPSPIDGDRPALIRQQLAELETLKAEALEELDERERADAEIGLGVDTDQAIALARRYEAACFRRMQWAQNQLKGGRKTPLAAPQRPESKPVPEPQPKPVPQPRPQPVATAEADEAAEIALLKAEFAAEDAELEALLGRPLPDDLFESETVAPTPPPAPAGNRKARRARRALARKG